jgi:hypothetical protein
MCSVVTCSHAIEASLAMTPLISPISIVTVIVSLRYGTVGSTEVLPGVPSAVERIVGCRVDSSIAIGFGDLLAVGPLVVGCRVESPDVGWGVGKRKTDVSVGNKVGSAAICVDVSVGLEVTGAAFGDVTGMFIVDDELEVYKAQEGSSQSPIIVKVTVISPPFKFEQETTFCCCIAVAFTTLYSGNLYRAYNVDSR